MAARRATDYINACADALEVGIDFTPRNVHSGQHWPLAKQQRKYVRENLTWIDGVGLAEKKTL